jgi:hypothetical protein
VITKFCDVLKFELIEQFPIFIDTKYEYVVHFQVSLPLYLILSQFNPFLTLTPVSLRSVSELYPTYSCLSECLFRTKSRMHISLLHKDKIVPVLK